MVEGKSLVWEDHSGVSVEYEVFTDGSAAYNLLLDYAGAAGCRIRLALRGSTERKAVALAKKLVDVISYTEVY